MTAFDALAEDYDATRGGEERGDDYAALIDTLLPPGHGVVLEIGVGTGVVALGLRRRGRHVVGLDLSAAMLRRARARLGATVALSDALAMAVATGAVAHAVSVWVVHAVADPVQLLREALRVVRPGGLYVVCSTQRPHPGDEIGRLIDDMGSAVDVRRRAERPRKVSVDQVLDWGEVAGFGPGTVHRSDRTWLSSPAQELFAIEQRIWPAMRELDEDDIAEVTAPVVAALRAMPQEHAVRRATTETVVLPRP